MWPRCPKCRSREVEIFEVWDASISWSPGDPQFNEGSLNPGDPMKVGGNCLDCSHRWRFRGIVQVKDEWFENNA